MQPETPNATSGKSDQRIDWKHIQATFEKIREEIGDIRILSDDDFERYKLSRLTFGHVKAPAWKRVEYGTAIYVHPSKESLYREMWEMLANDFSNRPAYLPAPPDHFAIVKLAIEKRRLSTEFLDSWGELNARVATFRAFLLRPDVSGDLVKKAIAGAQQGVEVQQHWFANWLAHNAPSFDRQERDSAESDLGVLCWQIKKGKVKPWGRYPVDWYARVLGEEKTDQAEKEAIGDNFRKLGAPKLKEMLRHPLLTPEVLPPLTVADFEKI